MYKIYSNGKDTLNGPFKTRKQAEEHCQKLREFVMKKVKSGQASYKKSFADLDKLEIKDLDKLEIKEVNNPWHNPQSIVIWILMEEYMETIGYLQLSQLAYVEAKVNTYKHLDDLKLIPKYDNLVKAVNSSEEARAYGMASYTFTAQRQGGVLPRGNELYEIKEDKSMVLIGTNYDTSG